MNIDLNELFFIMPKKQEHVNNPKKLEIKKYFDFNYIDLFQLASCHKFYVSNTVEQSTILSEEDFSPIESDMVIKVAFKKIGQEYAYQSYYPYSMQQANFLYQIGVNVNFLTNVYSFKKEEIINGYAMRKGLKEEFYPLLMEFDKEGIYHFNSTIKELPEFIDINFLTTIKETFHLKPS